MKILMVGNFFASPVGRGVCEELAVYLTTLGWMILTTSNKRSRLARLADMVGTAWHARQHYVAAQVDVFSGFAFLWAEAVCWTLRLAGKPFILTLHGGNLPVFAQRWQKRVRLLLGMAAAVTAPSPYLVEKMKPYRPDLHLLPNPLDLTAYQFKLRQQCKPQLVWLRAFHEIYNPSLAPQVVALLARDFPQVHLTMVGPDRGDGSLEATQQTAVELEVADRITFAGGVPKSEVSNWLNRGDIFLNTTNIDNTPVTVLEAMACGLCVVSTNVGGIPFLLKPGYDALLVPADDPPAMAAAIGRLLSERSLAERLSQNGRHKVEQFDWTAILPLWKRLFEQVLIHG